MEETAKIMIEINLTTGQGDPDAPKTPLVLEIEMIDDCFRVTNRRTDSDNPERQRILEPRLISDLHSGDTLKIDLSPGIQFNGYAASMSKKEKS